MSSGQVSAANRKAALEQLKFKKVQKQQVTASNHSTPSLSSEYSTSQLMLDGPPLQSRDATATSRYFPATPLSSGNVLVPSSSPLTSDNSNRSNPSLWAQENIEDGIPGLIHSEVRSGSYKPYVDPLTGPSGFVVENSIGHASFTRPTGGIGRTVSEVEDMGDEEPPRKRLNRGDSKDPVDFLSSPGSPAMQRPAQRRKMNGMVASSPESSNESLPDVRDVVAGPSKPRTVRHVRAESHVQQTLSSDQSMSQSDIDESRYIRFKITQPQHSSDTIRAAWEQASGDVPKATSLLNDPSWRPPTSSTSSASLVARPVSETGRVKEFDEAKQAQRAAIREKAKNSTIYKSRPNAEIGVSSRPGPSTPAKSVEFIPSSHIIRSPPNVQPRSKRTKRKIVDSESEAESDSSEEVSERFKRVKEQSSDEDRVLDYFNNSSSEALQELTGCTVQQATAILALRPFATVADLKTKLGQGRKKAGPAGISPRMIEDCTAIFEGYGKVDDILEDCEQIGTTLRAEIASWTSDSSRNTPIDSNAAEGVLSLRSQAVLPDRKPSYYLTSQPSLVSGDIQLKEYQMVGVNWLNLLYRKKLSCILADEMGLGKTAQVISFFAHLKESGRIGPHLIVVPSSTLENWCREFSRFAPSVKYETYYAGKNDRSVLRERLVESQRSKDDEGWEVLITTYNLAQGDDKDRKFFRRINWDACVFDEGHVLKNFQSQRYQTLLRYESRWRLLLTGTPLQNNLQELVSLMNFILPQQFADELDSLRAVFKTKGDSKVTLLAQERVSRAKKMMTPFVLRRRKDQVLQDLPKKTERIEWCEMNSLQRTIYNEALQRSRKTIFDVNAVVDDPPSEGASNGRGKASKKTRSNTRTKDKMYLENSSNVLMDLRKASSHPMLFRRRFTDDKLSSIAKLLLKEPDFKKRGAVFQYVKEDMEVMTDAELQFFCSAYKSTRRFLLDDDAYLQAGKIKVLSKLLCGYQNEGRRVLIFSQFTQILDILQKVLEIQNIKYLVLTGSTPVDARQGLVDEFTGDESISVFLLSTKAGGMGINLTAASVVIMFDQDFNPHNDKQAQDRAYRIGQKRDVDVVKLITKGSIEEDMLALGQTKLALDEAVAGEEGEERVEQEVKTSLMNVVRKKLEENPNETSTPDDEGRLSKDTEAMDLGSPLSVIDD